MSDSKLHVGCGKRNFGPGWKHIDGATYEHIEDHDIFLKNIPANTSDVIYSSHLLEYFDRIEAITLLTYWNRVLKPGGNLFLGVPDFETIAKMYLNKEYELEAFLGPLYGRMDIGESKIYHRTVYDFKSLCRILAQCGFRVITKVDSLLEYANIWNQDDHSEAVLPHMSAEGTSISLNIVCTK
jgi:predicted SAM-dependent methyltransferase